jgi:hypothetical protein
MCINIIISKGVVKVSTTEKTIMIVTNRNTIYEYIAPSIEAALNTYIKEVITFKNGFAISEDAWNVLTGDGSQNRLNSAIIRIELINALCKRYGDQVAKVVTGYSSVYPDFQGITADGVSYKIRKDGLCAEVVKYSGTAESIEIVSAFEGLPVVSIADGAFRQSAVKQIRLPSSITYIGTEAFCESALTSIYIPDSVTDIGSRAFSNCSSLNTIVFIGNAPSFGSDVFNNVSATVSYPSANYTWADDLRKDYGGTIEWDGDCSKGHAWVIDEAVEPDCINTGLTEGSHCYACGAIGVAQQIIPAIPGAHKIEYGVCTGCGKYGACGEDLTWALGDDGVLTISGSGSMYDYFSLATPWDDVASLITTAVFNASELVITGELFLKCSNLNTIIFN